MSVFDVLVPTLVAAADPAPVASGRITGGWGYVGLAYGLTYFILLAYGASLWVRRPRTRKDLQKP